MLLRLSHTSFIVFGLIAASLQSSSVVAFSPIIPVSSSVMSNLPNNKKEIIQKSSTVSATGSEYGASSTSFYTTVEKKDQYESLESILNKHCSDPKVREIITDMLDVCAEITEALRSALVTVEGSMNDFGDAQLSVDVRHVKNEGSVPELMKKQ